MQQRWRVEVTAPPGVDPVPTWAMLALAVDKQCRLRGAGARTRSLALDVPGGRLVGEVEPAAAGPDAEQVLAEVLEVVARQAARRAERDGTTATVDRLADG